METNKKINLAFVLAIIYVCLTASLIVLHTHYKFVELNYKIEQLNKKLSSVEAQLE